MKSAGPGRKAARVCNAGALTTRAPGEMNEYHFSARFENLMDAEDNTFFLSILQQLFERQFQTRAKAELTLDLLESWERWLLKDARASWVKIKERAIPVRHCLDLFEPKHLESATGVEQVLQQTTGVIGLMFEVLRRTANGTRNFDYEKSHGRSWLLYWLRLQSLDILDQTTSSRRSGAEVPRFVSIDEDGYANSSEHAPMAASRDPTYHGGSWRRHPRLSDSRDPFDIIQHREALYLFAARVYEEEARVLTDIDAKGPKVLSWCARQLMAGKSRQEILLSRQWADDEAIRNATNAILDQACTRFREQVRVLKLDNLTIAIMQRQENPRLNTIAGTRHSGYNEP